jgi:methylated-DNA-[protein]-cysteine S-methyltransferase
MGQRVASPMNGRQAVERRAEVQFCAFSTASGWMGLAGRNGRVSGLLLGHTDRRSVMDRARELYADGFETADWTPDLVARLQAYMQGATDDFADVELDLPVATAFQEAVREAVRAIPYGQTATYAEVARRAGSPRAARGVGGVMSSNRIPILIPCHRVVASGGGLGGFSAPRGVDLKRWLLEREAEGVAGVGPAGV